VTVVFGAVAAAAVLESWNEMRERQSLLSV
jgi:hypothetical protein